MSLRFNFARSQNRVVLRSIEFNGVKAYRGKDSVLSPVTFQWTSGVQCLVKLALGSCWTTSFCMEDRALYDAMSKPQRWYQDLFGSTRICFLNVGQTRLRSIPCRFFLEGAGEVRREQVPQFWKEVFGEMLQIREYLSDDVWTFPESDDQGGKAQRTHLPSSSGLAQFESLLNQRRNTLAIEAAHADMIRLASGFLGPIMTGSLAGPISDTLVRMALLRSIESLDNFGMPTFGATLVDGQAFFSVGSTIFSASLFRCSQDSSELCFRIMSRNREEKVSCKINLFISGLWFSHLFLSFPVSLKPLILSVTSYLLSYLLTSLQYVDKWLKSSILQLNNSGVEKVYEVVRLYLRGLGLSDDISDEFSLFLHQGGTSRYLLDSRRLEGVRNSLKHSRWVTATERSIINPTTESLSWYATSYLRSEETMSYTDAIIPWKGWDGSPDTWKKPIPGFGASEVAVYGCGTSHAEPVALPTDIDQKALCAVFTGMYADSLCKKFLVLPQNVQIALGHALEEVTFSPVGDIDCSFG